MNEGMLIPSAHFQQIAWKKTSNKIKAHKKEGEWKEGQKANNMEEKRTERK